MALILVKRDKSPVKTADNTIRRPWTMAAANAPNPLGIHLGPTHLTAAEVTVQGNHLVRVARISGGPSYRQEYLRTLEPSYHPDRSTSNRIFEGPEQEHDSLSQSVVTSAVRTIKEAAEKNLKRPIDDAIIVVPAHFNHYSVWAVERAARIVGLSMRYPLGRVSPFNIALHKAYQLDRCRVVGHPLTYDYYEGHVVLSIDYNSASLGLSVLEADSDSISHIWAHLEDPLMGEDTLPIDLDRSLSNKLSQKISNFLSEGTDTIVSRQKKERKDYKILKSEIRAVVLSGDASTQGFDNVRKLLREDFEDLCDGPIIDHLDPAYVLAYGAARLAKECTEADENRGKLFTYGDTTDWFRKDDGEDD